MGSYLDIVRQAKPAQAAAPVKQETAEERCARLDRQRYARDKRLRRGYDVDCGAAEHREFLARTGIDCLCLH